MALERRPVAERNSVKQAVTGTQCPEQTLTLTFTGYDRQHEGIVLSQRASKRQLLEAGAVCGKTACTDLCGGRPVTGVPTAILWRRQRSARPSNYMG